MHFLLSGYGLGLWFGFGLWFWSEGQKQENSSLLTARWRVI